MESCPSLGAAGSVSARVGPFPTRSAWMFTVTPYGAVRTVTGSMHLVVRRRHPAAARLRPVSGTSRGGRPDQPHSPVRRPERRRGGAVARPPRSLRRSAGPGARRLRRIDLLHRSDARAGGTRAARQREDSRTGRGLSPATPAGPGQPEAVPLYTEDDVDRVMRADGHRPVRHGAGDRRPPRHAARRRTHPRIGDDRRGGGRTDPGLHGRPRPARHADPSRSRGPAGGGPAPHGVHLRRPRARFH